MMKRFGYLLWFGGAVLLFLFLEAIKSVVPLSQPFDNPLASQWGPVFRILLDIVFGGYLGLLVALNADFSIDKRMLVSVVLPCLAIVVYQISYYASGVPLVWKSLETSSFFEIILGVSIVLSFKKR